MPAAILHLLGTAQPEGTGIARIVARLASGLDRDRYRVHAWFLGPPGPLTDDLRNAGANVRSIAWWRGAHDPAGAYRFWRCLREQEFAIVHQHFGGRSVRRIVRFSSHARLVVHLHGRVSERDRVAEGADLVVAASHAIASDMPRSAARVIHAGVELPVASCPVGEVPAGGIVIGAACRLVSDKGLIDLLRAMALLRPQFRNLRLEIAGEGAQLGDLRTEIARLDLSDRVEFLGWQRDIAATFQKWNIFAMPSLDEGFGMAALEAMAAGLPVVATSAGGLPEIVEDGRTGYLVPPGDVNALAGAMALLIANPEQMRAMGVAGRERARLHFSVARMAAEFASVYDSLLRPARG